MEKELLGCSKLKFEKFYNWYLERIEQLKQEKKLNLKQYSKELKKEMQLQIELQIGCLEVRKQVAQKSLKCIDQELSNVNALKQKYEMKFKDDRTLQEIRTEINILQSQLQSQYQNLEILARKNVLADHFSDIRWNSSYLMQGVVVFMVGTFCALASSLFLSFIQSAPLLSNIVCASAVMSSLGCVGYQVYNHKKRKKLFHKYNREFKKHGLADTTTYAEEEAIHKSIEREIEVTSHIQMQLQTAIHIAELKKMESIEEQTVEKSEKIILDPIEQEFGNIQLAKQYTKK